jgi:hypothetical protein
MTYYFDAHAARYLFFAPAEEVTLTIQEAGPHALGRITSAPGLDHEQPRSVVFAMPSEGGQTTPVDVDAAFSGTMADFLQSNSQVRVRFEGSKGTHYVQSLRPHGGTGRWTYLTTVREPNASWYLCSTPCKDWQPTKTKPTNTHCPYCRTGIIVKVDF